MYQRGVRDAVWRSPYLRVVCRRSRHSAWNRGWLLISFDLATVPLCSCLALRSLTCFACLCLCLCLCLCMCFLGLRPRISVGFSRPRTCDAGVEGDHGQEWHLPEADREAYRPLHSKGTAATTTAAEHEGSHLQLATSCLFTGSQRTGM